MKISCRQRAVISYCMLALSLVLVGGATILSVNSNGQNTFSSHNSSGTVVCAQPANVTTPENMSSHVVVQVSIQTTSNITHVMIYRYYQGEEALLVNANFSPREYFAAFISLSSGPEANNISIQVQNQTAIIVHLSLEPSDLGLIAELFLLGGIGTFVVFFLTVEIRSKRYLYLVPVYIALSIIYGQRYDDYFMISLGMRLFDKVNPYLPAGFTPPGLQWEYPPLYAIWSYFVVVFTHYVLEFRIPSNTQLNYIEVSYNNVYSAWRALAGSNLIILYGLAKLPFVLSFFWINSIIVRMSGKQQWKLWLINPFAVVVGIMWGQLDVLGLAFLLQALAYHKQGKDFNAVLFASIGAAIKIFPVFVMPLLIARSRNKILSVSAIIPVMLLSLLMYAASGNVLMDLNTLFMGRAVPTYLGVFISEGLTWQVIVSDLLVRSFPSLFLYVFAPAYIIYTAYAIRKGVSMESYFIICMLMFFVTYNFMNPQYLIWILPFFILLGEVQYAALISILGSLYLFLDYSYAYFLNPDIAWNYNASFLGQLEEVRHAIDGNSIVMGAFGVLSSVIFACLLYRMLTNKNPKYSVSASLIG
ncbi:MAG: DUF2029 domain-containing protein [Candidatus Thermoplasmatota archaeon]|nr:DUF2029 domain-containing protein [Candidatus Thermoplasmatota archaeon]